MTPLNNYALGHFLRFKLQNEDDNRKSQDILFLFSENVMGCFACEQEVGISYRPRTKLLSLVLTKGGSPVTGPVLDRGTPGTG